MSKRTTRVEICVEDSVGVDAAKAGGADRIELCSALAVGGLTPSPALVVRAVASGLPVHAMVRPVQGDFVCDAGTVALMIDEIAHLRSLGVAGIVLGATRPDGALDRDAMAWFRDAAQGLQLVLHRAIDLVPDPLAAIDCAASLGYDHVLSSGGAASATEGAAMLTAMVAEARGRLAIIAGAGVRADNVAALVALTGVDAIHSSAASPIGWRDPRIVRFGFAVGTRRIADASLVRSLVNALP